MQYKIGLNKLYRIALYKMHLSRGKALKQPYWSQLGEKYLYRSLLCSEFEAVTLIKQADLICDLPLISVTDKSTPPPSGEKRDYFSFAPYWWPGETQTIGDLRDPLSQQGGFQKDGFTNPWSRANSDKPRMAQVCARIHYIATAYLLQGNERYANYIERQLRNFFLDDQQGMTPHLMYGQIRPWTGQRKGNGIIDTRWLVLILDAMAMLRSAGYQLQGEIQMNQWLNSYLRWLLFSNSGHWERRRSNNRASWYYVQVAFISNFLGYDALAKHLCRLCNATQFGRQFTKEGWMPLELRRYTMVKYSIYNIYPLKLMLELCKFYKLNCDAKHSKVNAAVNRILDLRRNWEVEYPQMSAQDKECFGDFVFTSTFDLNLFYPYDITRVTAIPVVWPTQVV